MTCDAQSGSSSSPGIAVRLQWGGAPAEGRRPAGGRGRAGGQGGALTRGAVRDRAAHRQHALVGRDAPRVGEEARHQRLEPRAGAGDRVRADRRVAATLHHRLVGVAAGVGADAAQLEAGVGAAEVREQHELGAPLRRRGAGPRRRRGPPVNALMVGGGGVPRAAGHGCAEPAQAGGRRNLSLAGTRLGRERRWVGARRGGVLSVLSSAARARAPSRPGRGAAACGGRRQAPFAILEQRRERGRCLNFGTAVLAHGPWTCTSASGPGLGARGLPTGAWLPGHGRQPWRRRCAVVSCRT